MKVYIGTTLTGVAVFSLIFGCGGNPIAAFGAALLCSIFAYGMIGE